MNRKYGFLTFLREKYNGEYEEWLKNNMWDINFPNNPEIGTEYKGFIFNGSQWEYKERFY